MNCIYYSSGTEEALRRGAGRPLAELLLHVGLDHRLREVRAVEGLRVQDRLRERRALGLGVCQDGVLQVGALEGRAREVGAREVGALAIRFEEPRAAQGRLLEARVDGIRTTKVLVVELLAVEVLVLDRGLGVVLAAAADRGRGVGQRHESDAAEGLAEGGAARHRSQRRRHAGYEE